MHFSQTPCERSGSWARKKRQGSFLAWSGLICMSGPSASAERTCSSYLQRMCVSWETQSLDTWTVGFRNFFYPTDPRNNDRLTHARKSAKKLSDFRKAYMFKGEVTFMRVRVWFAFWRTVILTIRGPRIWSTNFGDASGQRHVGGRRRDTHTAKCEHTVKHYCFIDIDTTFRPGCPSHFQVSCRNVVF